MKLRPFALLLACALLALGAVAAGCKNGDGSTSTAGTLREYFQRVQELDKQASSRLDVISQILNTPTDSEEQKLAAIKDYITQQIAIDKDLRGGLQQLSPPDEVKDAHQEAIGGLTAFIDFAQNVVDQAAAATAAVDLIAILDNPEARSISTRLQESCVGLQKAAADHGIQITLDCGR